MSKPIAWIDVTDLEVWSGHMTGVQRVVYENLCRLYADETIVAKGFKFDPYLKDIYQVDLEDIVVNFGVTHESSPSETSIGKAALLKGIARTTYFKLPGSVRSRITDKHKQRIVKGARSTLEMAHHTLHTARSVRARAQQRTSSEAPAPAVIQAADTVLVIGKIWDTTALVDLLADQKHRIGFRYVQVVHDLIPVFQPQLFGNGLFEPYAQYLFETLAAADVIACVSKSTERDVQRLAKELHFPKPKTVVIELGDSPLSDIVAKRPAFITEREEFILSVGTVEARKNHAMLYQVWKLAEERGVKLPRLIIVGSQGWLVGDMLHAVTHDPMTKERITFHQHIPDAQVKWLYENCLFTVFPSIYEGWGLPIAESLAYGKVCIPSKTSSMTEIAGNLLDYVSPHSSDEILTLVQTYLNANTRLKKEAEIAKKYQKRSWDDCYKIIRTTIR